MKSTKIVGIYIIKNLLNNKIYIGSSKNIYSRWYQHRKELKLGYHHSKHLQDSYNKYGVENFEYSILEQCSEDQLLEREIYYINLYNSYNSEIGYNMSIPNKTSCGIGEHTKETKLKLSQIRYNKLQPGISFEEWKANIDANKKAVVKARGEKKDPSIYQIDGNTGEILNQFSSSIKAGEALNLNYKRIQEVLAGFKIVRRERKTRRSYQGFVFIYCRDYDPTKDYKVVYPRNFSQGQLKTPVK